MSMRVMPICLALLSALLFGAATPASKLLLAEVTPFQLAGLLYLGAALAVAPSAKSGGGIGLPGRTDRRNRLRLLGAVGFGGVLGPVALLYGLQLAGAASVSLWLNLELAATAVLGVLLFKDQLGGRGWLGVAAALLASLLVAQGPGATGLVPVLLVLAACVCWGVDNHLTALIDGITPSQSTFWKGLVAGSVNLAIGLYLAPITLSAWTLCLALLVGGLSYGASIVLYIRSAQALGATRAQVLFASAPFFGVSLSVVMLGEPLAGMQLVAIPIFLLGVALLLLESHSHLHAHEAMTHEHFHSHDDGHHDHSHEGEVVAGRHSHRHTHEPMIHRHPHWPDLHHRHAHEDDDS